MKHAKEFRAAFQASIPVLLGYLAIGMAFGLMINGAGYPWWLALVMSVVMLAGAGQYLAVGFFSKGAGLGEMALLTFLVNARHMVYGVSLLEKFRGLGASRIYLMFALTDETYALLTSVQGQEGLDRGSIYRWIALLDHVYWVAGSLLGVVIGRLLPIPTEDVGFALTALFVVLTIDRLRQSSAHSPFLLALVAVTGGALLAGPALLLPAIGIGLVLLLVQDLLRHPPRRSPAIAKEEDA